MTTDPRFVSTGPTLRTVSFRRANVGSDARGKADGTMVVLDEHRLGARWVVAEKILERTVFGVVFGARCRVAFRGRAKVFIL